MELSGTTSRDDQALTLAIIPDDSRPAANADFGTDLRLPPGRKFRREGAREYCEEDYSRREAHAKAAEAERRCLIENRPVTRKLWDAMVGGLRGALNGLADADDLQMADIRAFICATAVGLSTTVAACALDAPAVAGRLVAGTLVLATISLFGGEGSS